MSALDTAAAAAPYALWGLVCAFGTGSWAFYAGRWLYRRRRP